MQTMTDQNAIRIIFPGRGSIPFYHVWKIDTEDLKKVFDALEIIFSKWNNSDLIGKGYVDLMLAGDVITIDDLYYQRTNLGWNEIDGEFLSELEKEIQAHPKLGECGAHYALCEIMWLRKHPGKIFIYKP